VNDEDKTKTQLIEELAELRRRNVELEAIESQIKTLYEISRGLNTARDEAEILAVLRQIVADTRVDSAVLDYIEVDQAGQPTWLELVAVWGNTPPPGTRLHIPDFPYLRQWLAQSEEPIIIADIEADEHLDAASKQIHLQFGVQALTFIPLIQAGRWAGGVVFTWPEPRSFSEAEQALFKTVATLAAPVVENRRLLSNLEKIVKARTQELGTARALIENAHDGIWTLDLAGHLTYANPSEATLFGYGRPAEMLGLNMAEMIAAEDLEFARQNIPTALSTGWQGELRLVRKDGSFFMADVSIFAITDEQGQPTTLAGLTRDISERKQAELERGRLQQELIESQQRAIRELSTPIIPIMKGIIILPLIGSIDSERAREVTRSLLAGISQHRAKIVIVDITGVSVVDSGVASHLDKTIQAARLKGAQTIITGISDAVAETIVDLGINWSGLETVNNLQAGLAVAMRKLGQ
jgi:PAS domain S-box-containing protein